MSDGYAPDDRIGAITALEGYFGSDIQDDSMEALEYLDATPNDELRALIEKWRESAGCRCCESHSKKLEKLITNE